MGRDSRRLLSTTILMSILIDEQHAFTIPPKGHTLAHTLLTARAGGRADEGTGAGDFLATLKKPGLNIDISEIVSRAACLLGAMNNIHSTQGIHARS